MRARFVALLLTSVASLWGCDQRGYLEVEVHTSLVPQMQIDRLDIVVTPPAGYDARMTTARITADLADPPYPLRIANPTNEDFVVRIEASALLRGATVRYVDLPATVVPATGATIRHVWLDCELDCGDGECVAGACRGPSADSGMVMRDAGTTPIDAAAPMVDASARVDAYMPMMGGNDAAVGRTDAFVEGPDAFVEPVDAFVPPPDAFCAGMMCGGNCVDTNSNPRACGSCDALCSQWEFVDTSCDMGRCRYVGLTRTCLENHGDCNLEGFPPVLVLRCDQGWANRDNNSANGCESPT